jgi:hypothetical protein
MSSITDNAKWLEIALAQPEWVATQKAAWERWNTPEFLGEPAPQFVLLSEETLWRALHQLEKRFGQVAQRHQVAAKLISQIRTAYREQCRLEGLLK